MHEIDIWRTAQELIRWQGGRAEDFAERSISDLALRGDPAGALVWRKILAAVLVLQKGEAPEWT